MVIPSGYVTKIIGYYFITIIISYLILFLLLINTESSYVYNSISPNFFNINLYTFFILFTLNIIRKPFRVNRIKKRAEDTPPPISIVDAYPLALFALLIEAKVLMI